MDKRYEEALERAKELHEAGNALTKAQIEIVFPELKESEDERIREELIGGLMWQRDFLDAKGPRDNNLILPGFTMNVGKLIDWLERQKEQKPAEWSEEDEFFRQQLIVYCENCVQDSLAAKCVDWLKSLRPQPKEEREPMEIKYGGKVYQVYAVRSLPGGATGYIIEDEPGHYDCIIHPDEVLGGGYGIKSNGSPYPTKEANFGQHHWKPSEEQMDALKYALGKGGSYNKEALDSLLTDLQNYFSL